MNKSKILWWAFLTFVFCIPVSQQISIRVLLVVVAFAFFVRGNSSRFFRQSWDLLLYLAVLLIGQAYTEDKAVGWKLLETSLSFLAIPFVFNRFTDFSKYRLQEVFYAFAAGVLAASLLCTVYAGYRFLQTGDVNVFFFDQFTQVIDSHPTYLAYYLITIIAFGLFLLYYEKSRVSPLLIVVAIAFFFLSLMLTGGMTAFVSILLIFSFFVLKYLSEEKGRKQTIAFGVVILLTLGLFGFHARYSKAGNDNWERFVLWESAIKATPNVVLGVGTGDYNKVLNQYYLAHQLDRFADSNYNSHNQFIQILFSNGLIGVLALSILLGRPLYLSMQNQDILGSLTVFPFIIYGMTEVFLGRYQGVVYFTLFHQTFITYYLHRRPSFPRKDV